MVDDDQRAVMRGDRLHQLSHRDGSLRPVLVNAHWADRSLVAIEHDHQARVFPCLGFDQPNAHLCQSEVGATGNQANDSLMKVTFIRQQLILLKQLSPYGFRLIRADD